MYQNIETTLITLLKEDFPTYEVEAFPLEFENYSVTGHDGCLLVKYSGSNFSEQQSLWEVEQQETLNYSVIAGLNYLNSYSDLNPFLEKLKQCLKNKEIENFKVTFKQIQSINEIDGILWLGVLIQLKMPN